MASQELRGEETLVEQVLGLARPGELEDARAEFHARGGAFEPGEPFYEERIRAFLDFFAFEWGAPRALLLRRALAAGLLDAELATALAAHARSLYRAVRIDAEGIELECLLGDARFVVSPSDGPLRSAEGAAARLREGDVLDGRLAWLAGAVRLLPGPVFHPREAHAAMLALVRDARAADRPRTLVLDGLMRMRMRFDRFVSIDARHVYRFDALERREILAAPWARHG